jgi:hypothetical protein
VYRRAAIDYVPQGTRAGGRRRPRGCILGVYRLEQLVLDEFLEMDRSHCLGRDNARARCVEGGRDLGRRAGPRNMSTSELEYEREGGPECDARHLLLPIRQHRFSDH